MKLSVVVPHWRGEQEVWYAANERRFTEKWGWTPPPTDPRR